jgi:hypothetical protein
VMLAAARVLAEGSGGSVVAVLLGHNSQELAGDLAADRVLYVDHPALRISRGQYCLAIPRLGRMWPASSLRAWDYRW